MNSLIIGSTSQLAHYFPQEYERIESRFIREKMPLPLKEDFYDRVYICFAEQRLEINNLEMFIKTNVDLTLDLIKFFNNKSNHIIVYGSCELWNNYNGAIDINDQFNYAAGLYNNYCISKELMVEKIHETYDNVSVLHPFNFNSIHRKPGYLFYKIFDSIINKKKIEIGDTYFYRDIIHPKYVVERSLVATSDEIIGSGRLTFINDFIRDLYKNSGLDYDEYVTEKLDNNNKKSIFYLRSKEIKYTNLLKDTIDELAIASRTR